MLISLNQVAVKAMQAALNATATSTLAMDMTKEALHRSANQETDELISVLNQVRMIEAVKRSDPSESFWGHF